MLFLDGKVGIVLLLYCNFKKIAMKKVTTLILMLCLILSGALCYASGSVGTENEKGEGTPVIVIMKTPCGGTDKSGSVSPSINGHILTVVFDENLGQVSVEITTDTGAMVACVVAHTPNGLQFYIPNAGSYSHLHPLQRGRVLWRV